jgi:hypothetical protein
MEPSARRLLVVIGAAFLAAGCGSKTNGRGDAGAPRDAGDAPRSGTDAPPDVPEVCQRLGPCCQRYRNPEFIPSCQATAATGPAALCELARQGDPRVRLCADGAEREACTRLGRDCCPRLPADLRQDCERHVSLDDPAECVDRLEAYEACREFIYPPDAGP